MHYAKRHRFEGPSKNVHHAQRPYHGESSRDILGDCTGLQEAAMVVGATPPE
jgi:hypothetical protein